MRVLIIAIALILMGAGGFALGRTTVLFSPPDDMATQADWITGGFKDVDLGGLTPEQQAVAIEVLNTQRDNCGCDDLTLAESLSDITICEEGRRLANRIVTMAGEGRTAASILTEAETLVNPRIQVPIEGSPVRGPANAPITMVEFSCFSCGYSRKIQETLTLLDQKYPGQIRHVYKFFPLGYKRSARPFGQTLAQASIAGAKYGKFWELHDAMFAQYTELRRAAADPEKFNGMLAEIAQRHGVPPDAIIAGSTAPETEAVIERDYQVAQSIGVRGTPHFLINGRRIPGAMPYCTFRNIFDEELERHQQRAQAAAASSS